MKQTRHLGPQGHALAGLEEFILSRSVQMGKPTSPVT